MADRLFWVVLSRLWSGWREILVIVKPVTVIGWHRKGFRRFWTRKVATGEAGTTARVERIPRAYPPDVSGESVVGRSPESTVSSGMLGFEVSEAAVSKYMPRHPKPPSQTWRTFLENHVGCLASTDFFVVPTATFSLLFVLVVLRHERRRIVHHRHHGTPDCGVGRATDPGGLSVGDSTTVYDPRSGSCVRYCLSFADKGDGHRRGRDGAAIAVAVAVR